MSGHVTDRLALAAARALEPAEGAQVEAHLRECAACASEADEWLPPGLDWDERRHALVETPRLDREDWYARVLLAARHRPPP